MEGDRQDFISGNKRYIGSRSNGVGAEWGSVWFVILNEKHRWTEKGEEE